jgi:hypothetical protein
VEERRRYPRQPADGQLLGLPSAISVRVVDISVAGVLLQAARPVEVGLRGYLRFIVSGAPVTAQVQVQRVSVMPGTANGFRIGATFVAMSHEHRHLIERLIQQ